MASGVKGHLRSHNRSGSSRLIPMLMVADEDARLERVDRRRPSL